MALHSVRDSDNHAHLHRIFNHISPQQLLWHRDHSLHAKFSDEEASRIRPICRVCAHGSTKQTGTDHLRIHRPLATRPGQGFVMDAFTCAHASRKGNKYCDLMRDVASQMIYYNFSKSRSAADIKTALTETWLRNPSWLKYDWTPDHTNPRFIRMDSESAYQSQELLEFFGSRGYQIERTPPRDKHAGGIAERMVGVVTAKTNTAMLALGAPSMFWDWAMMKSVQDLNFNYSAKIGTSPYYYVTGHHIDAKYCHQFFAECYMHIPPKERSSKLPAKRAQRCKFLAYSFTTILVPVYVVVPVLDNNTYGNPRISKDVIFDESIIFSRDRDNSPSDEAFAALPDPTAIVQPTPDHPAPMPAPVAIEVYTPDEYVAADLEPPPDMSSPFPLIVADEWEIGKEINEYGIPVYWNTVTGDRSNTPIITVKDINYHVLMSSYNAAINTTLPKNFADAFGQTKWQAPIAKELNNFIENNCFQWTEDTGQRRLSMMWLFNVKADGTLKARLVARGDRAKPGLDYNVDEVYCGNVTASSIKIFFALAALYGLQLRGGDLVGAYLVTPGSKDFPIWMATPAGINAPPGMILQVLGNLYGLPSSGRNFSKAVDEIVLGLGYINTPYDPKFFVLWVPHHERPILVMFHSDDFRWCGPPDLLHEWDRLVTAFETARYKVKDCTKEPFVGINVTTDKEGNYYLDQKKAIEGVVKTAKVTGARVQKLPYPLEGEPLSKLDNANTPEEIKESARTPYRTLIGMLSYIMAHTKPDIAYALNVLSRYCNNPGPRHIVFLKCLIKYCEYSQDDRLKFHAHGGPYDPETMRLLTQIWYQCDADLGGNKDNLKSTSSHIGYLGFHNLVSFLSKTQGSLSTSTAESEIKAVNQCLKEDAIATRGMLNLMGFPQDTTTIEEDNQACVYASEIPHMTRGLRHLDLTEMYVKEKVEDKSIKLIKVASGDNTSDLGTKRLALPIFNKLTSKIIDKSLRVNL